MSAFKKTKSLLADKELELIFLELCSLTGVQFIALSV